MIRNARKDGVNAAAAVGCALWLALASSGCTGNGASAEQASGSSAEAVAAAHIPAGTSMEVRLGSTISSEHAKQGTAWSGTILAPVLVGDEVVIPAGSTVKGVVSGVRPAGRGSRAMLDLTVENVVVDGAARDVRADMEEVVAGSTRARNLGAIAGGAAAGALIGKAVGGDNKDAAIGGVIGGAAATGAVAGSKGYQVALKEGTSLTLAVSS